MTPPTLPFLQGQLANGGHARFRSTLAAVLSKEVDQGIHDFEARRIDHGPAVPPYGDKARVPEPVEVECERVRREFQLGGDATGWHSVRPRLNQQAEHVETALLGERGQSRNSIKAFHISIDIEMFGRRQ